MKDKEENVAVCWKHPRPTWDWVMNGYHYPLEWLESKYDPDEKYPWYPFWIRLAYWIDYSIFKCKWNKMCNWIDSIQWNYRKK